MSVFVDTNVLVYARDLSVPAKQERAHGWMSALWASRLPAVSTRRPRHVRYEVCAGGYASGQDLPLGR